MVPLQFLAFQNCVASSQTPNARVPQKSSSLVFPVGINVLLPFRLHEIVTQLPMPSPSTAFRLCASVRGGGVLPSCLTLGFSHCFLSVIRCYKPVHFQTVNDVGERLMT